MHIDDTGLDDFTVLQLSAQRGERGDASSEHLRVMSTTLGQCEFDNEPVQGYYWDPWCQLGDLGCNADGKHVACRFCSAADSGTDSQYPPCFDFPPPLVAESVHAVPSEHLTRNGLERVVEEETYGTLMNKSCIPESIDFTKDSVGPGNAEVSGGGIRTCSPVRFQADAETKFVYSLLTPYPPNEPFDIASTCSHYGKYLTWWGLEVHGLSVQEYRQRMGICTTWRELETQVVVKCPVQSADSFVAGQGWGVSCIDPASGIQPDPQFLQVLGGDWCDRTAECSYCNVTNDSVDCFGSEGSN